MVRVHTPLFVLCVLCVAASLVFSPLVVGQQDAESGNAAVETLVKRADVLMKAGALEQALESYTKAIEMDSSNYNLYYKRAAAYLARSKSMFAIADLNKVLEINPTFVQARLRRAKTFLSVGRADDAKKDYDAVLKVKPDEQEAIQGKESVKQYNRNMERAEDLFAAKNYPEVMPVLTTVLDLAPDVKEARLMRAQTALQMRDFNLVLEDATAVLKQHGSHVLGLFLRGQALYHLGDRETAIKHYTQALKYEPDDSRSKKELQRLQDLDAAQANAVRLLSQGKAQDALAQYQIAHDLEPANPLVTPGLILGKCKALSKLGKHAEAIAECTKVIEMDADNVDAYQTRADAHIEAEDFDRAIADYNKCVEKQPQNNSFRQSLHEAQKKQKMAARKDWYKVLGVKKDATPHEIKKAYRALAREYHPDTYKGERTPEIEAKFHDINNAYETLFDEEKRRKFDSGEDLQPQQGPFHHGGGFPFGAGGPGGFTFNFNFGGGG